MTELHLLRHAHAGDPAGWRGPDETRPLSDKGVKQADRLGRFLAAVGFEPDAIITSPKLRAAQTADRVAEALGLRVSIDDRLAGGLDPDMLEAILRDAGDPQRPVLVGHDPDFSELLDDLTGSSGLEMKKGAIARIDIDRPMVAGTGTLAMLVTPDVLKPGR